MSVEIGDNLPFYLRLLHPVILTCGIPLHDIRVVDICSGQGDLVFLLMDYFNLVGSNDFNPGATSPNKYALNDDSLWNMIHGRYNAIITRVNGEPEVALVASKLNQSSSPILAAFLVPVTTRPYLRCKSIEVEVTGFRLKWQLLFPNPAFKLKLDIRNVTLHPEVLAASSSFDLLVKYKMKLEQIHIYRKTRRFSVKEEEEGDGLMETGESLFYREAKILKSLTESNTFKHSKKKFIALLCNGSYRAVQRKIRIATLANAMPELKKMNLREAEERLKFVFKSEQTNLNFDD
jgi:hypothetical protein